MLAPLSSPAPVLESDFSDIPEGAFIDSTKIEGTVVVETSIDNPDIVDHNDILSAWDEVAPVSVEAAIAGRPGLYDFVNDTCLLFAAIRSPVRVKLSPAIDMQKAGLPSQSNIVWKNALILPEDPSTFYRKIRDGRELLHRSYESDSAASESSSSSGSPSNTESSGKAVFKWETIGIVYVTMSPTPSEVHIGVAILSPYRGKGAGMQAVAFAVQWAIETIQAHRVQARIMASSAMPGYKSDRAQRLFTALGFAHEGIQRRAITDAAGHWADVTHMGIVDTDWVIRRRLRAAPRNLWDELFERHQREREELLRWEEGQGTMRLRRTGSMETVRMSDYESNSDTPPSPCVETHSLSPSPSPSVGSAVSGRSRGDGELAMRWILHPHRNASSDTEDSDPFSDSEFVGNPSEPISRPQSAASWSSFESFESAATSSGVESPENELAWVRIDSDASRV